MEISTRNYDRMSGRKKLCSSLAQHVPEYEYIEQSVDTCSLLQTSPDVDVISISASCWIYNDTFADVIRGRKRLLIMLSCRSYLVWAARAEITN